MRAHKKRIPRLSFNTARAASSVSGCGAGSFWWRAGPRSFRWKDLQKVHPLVRGGSPCGAAAVLGSRCRLCGGRGAAGVLRDVPPLGSALSPGVAAGWHLPSVSSRVASACDAGTSTGSLLGGKRPGERRCWPPGRESAPLQPRGRVMATERDPPCSPRNPPRFPAHPLSCARCSQLLDTNLSISLPSFCTTIKG